MATTLGIVGCGAIGKALLKAADDGDLGPVAIAGVTSRTEGHRTGVPVNSPRRTSILGA